jgi:hypothetical protein
VWRELVGEDVEGDDAEDGTGEECYRGDEQERGVSAEGGQRVGCNLAEALITAPGAER